MFNAHMARSGGKPCWLQASCFITADTMDGQARFLPVEPLCSQFKRQDALRGVAHGSVSFPGFGVRRGRAGSQDRRGCDKFKDGPRDKHGQAYLKLSCPKIKRRVRPIKRRPQSLQEDKSSWNRNQNRSRCPNFDQQKFILKSQQRNDSAGSPTRRRRGCTSCPPTRERR